MGRARAMDHLLGNDEALSRIEGHCTILEIDEQLAVNHVEELIVCVMLVPVVRTFDDAQAHDGSMVSERCTRKVLGLVAAKMTTNARIAAIATATITTILSTPEPSSRLRNSCTLLFSKQGAACDHD